MPFFGTFRSPDRFAAGNAGEILLEKYDYDLDGNLIYQGAANSNHADDAADVWAICKYTYNIDNKLIRTEYRYLVSWDNRALLGWI
jgi:hypothetical protein